MTRPVQSLIAEHSDLFFTDWVTDPSSVQESAAEHGIKNDFTLEISAWCSEFHMQLQKLAEEQSLDLILMGGNAIAIRMNVSAQRGSRDNDYITSATEDEIVHLLEKFKARFSDFPDPFFCYDPLIPAKSNNLPLFSYKIYAPALLTRPIDGDTIQVKVEFHQGAASIMPDTERVTGRFLTSSHVMNARIPKPPYQFALKSVALSAPPVGIPPEREEDIPKNLYDLDLLLPQITNHESWLDLLKYSSSHYQIECGYCKITPRAGDNWQGFIDRLEAWNDCASKDTQHWKTIDKFQSVQLAKPSWTTSTKWFARVSRLQFLGQCLLQDEPGWAEWDAALKMSQRLLPVSGKDLREQKKVLADATNTYHKMIVDVQAHFWKSLASESDPTARSLMLQNLDANVSTA